jgi:hypothetical protein
MLEAHVEPIGWTLIVVGDLNAEPKEANARRAASYSSPRKQAEEKMWQLMEKETFADCRKSRASLTDNPLARRRQAENDGGVVEEDGKDITQSVIDSILVRQESMNRFVRAATIEPITGSKESFHKGLLLDIACNNPKSAKGTMRLKVKDMPPHQENEEGVPTAGWGKYALESWDAVQHRLAAAVKSKQQEKGEARPAVSETGRSIREGGAAENGRRRQGDL